MHPAHSKCTRRILDYLRVTRFVSVDRLEVADVKLRGIVGCDALASGLTHRRRIGTVHGAHSRCQALDVGRSHE